MSKRAIDLAWNRALAPAGTEPSHDMPLYAYTGVSGDDPPAGGIAVSLSFGPCVAFVPYDQIRGDETREETRSMLRDRIPGYAFHGRSRDPADVRRALSYLVGS